MNKAIVITPELEAEADRIWNDPEKMLDLIDLLFLGDDRPVLPS